jgi:hypothetical protein
MQGAEASQGPGWWQATDGRWYPPEAQPGNAPTTPLDAGGAGWPGGPPIPTAAGGIEGEGFFKRLFDVSMTSFVTPSIIKLLFVLAIIGMSIVSVIVLVGGFATIDEDGVILVILAPIMWLLGIIYWRVILELVIVVFRIERNTRNDR